MTAVGIDVRKAALDVGVKGRAGVKRFANTRLGIEQLLRHVRWLEAPRLVVEATGGYEGPLLERCSDAGLWVARIYPRQARALGRAMGDLVKTDAIDAHVLRRWPRLPRPAAAVPRASPWQRELRDWLRRRGQVVATLQLQKQQTALTGAAVRRAMAGTITVLKRELALIDRAIRALLAAHATTALRSSKGLGPVFQATSLALPPELGRLGCRQIARLVGVAR